MTFPKISIVTPNFNQARYLEHTIKSVFDQQYPNLEYIIIDGGSTDGSVDIIKKYQNQLAYWVSEKDRGLYHAIQKGFERSSGEIMGYLNSDDMLHPNSLFSIAEIFSIPSVTWVTGTPSTFDERGRTVEVIQNKPWSRLRFLLGDKRQIQQESTYWKRTLWNAAGGYVSDKYKLAGDFELWSRFFSLSKLHSCDCLIGGFRKRDGQLSENMTNYVAECTAILSAISLSEADRGQIKKISQLLRYKQYLRQSRIFNLESLQIRLSRKIEHLHEFPPMIRFDSKRQAFALCP